MSRDHPHPFSPTSPSPSAHSSPSSLPYAPENSIHPSRRFHPSYQQSSQNHPPPPAPLPSYSPPHPSPSSSYQYSHPHTQPPPSSHPLPYLPAASSSPYSPLHHNSHNSHNVNINFNYDYDGGETTRSSNHTHNSNPYPYYSIPNDPNANPNSTPPSSTFTPSVSNFGNFPPIPFSSPPNNHFIPNAQDQSQIQSSPYPATSTSSSSSLFSKVTPISFSDFPSKSLLLSRPPSWCPSAVPEEFKSLCLLSSSLSSSSLPLSQDCGTSPITLVGEDSNSNSTFIVHSSHQGPMVLDLFSPMGAFLNNKKLRSGEPIRIFDGDTIRMGDNSFRVSGVGCNRIQKNKILNEWKSGGMKDIQTIFSPYPSHSPSAPKRPRPTQVRVRHLLTKHSHSRRPSSHRNPHITLSREDAMKIQNDFYRELEREKEKGNFSDLENKFIDLANQYSDCSSHTKGGDLGIFTYEKMQPKFSEASFGLQVGEMVNGVETDSGFHIILRIQ